MFARSAFWNGVGFVAILIAVSVPASGLGNPAHSRKPDPEKLIGQLTDYGASDLDSDALDFSSIVEKKQPKDAVQSAIMELVRLGPEALEIYARQPFLSLDQRQHRVRRLS